MSLFRGHFPLDWQMELLHQKCPNSHDLPQDIAINKINFEYKLYNLCELLGVINSSPKA